MKKILIMAIALFSVVSCTKTVDNQALSNDSMSFQTLNRTRAANDSGSDYKIYADGGDGMWYINDIINGSGVNVDNPQNGPYFWPNPARDLTFYSYAPASVVANDTYPNISIDYTVPATAQEDFTIASPVTQNTGQVQLVFEHMLTKITITPKLSDALIAAGYTLDPAVTSFLSDLTMNLNNATYNVKTKAITQGTTTSTVYSGNNSYMVIPQSSVGVSIVIKDVVIKKGALTIFENDLSEYVIVAGDVPNDMFSNNLHYNIIMEINTNSTDIQGDLVLNEITFSSIVIPWINTDTPLVQS